MTIDYSQPLRTRFAPSPTGTLHVGGARTALFNYLLARKTGGAFVLRIEDTDLERNRAESEASLIADLRWLGFSWDEGPDIGGPYGPYRQSERLSLYASAVDTLIAHDRAYRCYCTPEMLAEDREQQRAAGVIATRYSGRCRTLNASARDALEREGRAFSVRFAVEPGTTVVDDLVKGRVVFDHDTIGDFVIAKTGGGPTYNFAAAIDDARMAISVVLRGDEHLPNTPLQLMIGAALDLTAPAYAHVPLILNESHAKLSKRHDTVGVDQFRDRGYFPEALIDHLALLGWSPGDEREHFGLAELASAFTIERVGKSGAVFDPARLRAFNARQFRALDRPAQTALILAAMQRSGLLEDPAPPAALRWIELFLDAYGTELHTVGEALPIIATLRAEAVTVPALELERLRNRQVLFFLDAIGQYVDDQPELRDLDLTHDIPTIGAEFGLKKKDAYHAVRMTLTGEAKGIPLHFLFPLLGHDRILMRIGAVNSHILHGRGLEPIAYGPGGEPFRTIEPQKPAEPLLEATGSGDA